MTATPAGRLLISHIPLRGPELAQLYAQVAARPEATLDELRADFCPAGASDSSDDLADAPLREALSFLTIAGLVEARGRPRRYTVAAPVDELFALSLLRRLAAHPDERQRAIALVHRQLVAEDTLAITPQALRDQMERGPLRDLFAWTGEKLLFWSHLTAFLGLVRRPARGAEILLVPQPALALDALHWASSQLTPLSRRSGRGAGGEGLPLADALSHIDAALFACLTSRGRVHRGLAQTLLAMERLGHIHLVHHADAARSLLLGERRVSAVSLITP